MSEISRSSPKRGRLVGRIATFMQRYGRKAPKGREPNDRKYDRDVERQVKRMKPEQLDALLRDDV